MADTKEDSHQGDQEEHQKRHIFSKVKGKLDFTKHLGFQSGPDTLANRAALANVREREEREAEEARNSQPAPEVGPNDDLGGVAESLAGTVTPKTGNTFTSPSKAALPAEEQNEQSNHSKPIQFDESPPHSINKGEDHTSEEEEEEVKEKSKESNKRENHTSEEEQVKEKSKEAEKGWGRWMTHKLHQVSRAAASKDLSDDLLKDSKAKK